MVELADPAELDALLDAAAYRALVEEELTATVAELAADRRPRRGRRRGRRRWRADLALPRRGRGGRAAGAAPLPLGRRRRCRSGASSPTTTSTATPARGSGVEVVRRPTGGRGAAPRRRPHLRGRDAAPGRAGRATSTRSTGTLAGGADRRARPARGRRPRSARTTARPGPVCFAAPAGRRPPGRGPQALRLGPGPARAAPSSSTARSSSTGSPFDETDLLRRAPGAPAVDAGRLRAATRHAAASSGRRPTPHVVADALVEGFRDDPRRRLHVDGPTTLDVEPHVAGVTVIAARSRRRYPRRPCAAAGAATRTRPAPTSARRAAARCPARTETTLSLTELAERLELDEELGEALGRAARGHGHAGRAPRARTRAAASCSTATVTALGRHPDSDIFLDDITVSRRHAVVERDRRRLRGRATSARSTAPTSTTSGSTQRRCTTATSSRSAASCSMFLRREASRVSDDDGADGRTSRSARCSPSCATSSPTSRSRRSGSSRARGSIDPERTPSGYRKFYAADLARLRWILHQQKEHFLPLKVIKERLDELAAGRGAARRSTSTPTPRDAPAAPRPSAGDRRSSAPSAPRPAPAPARAAPQAPRARREPAADVRADAARSTTAADDDRRRSATDGEPHPRGELAAAAGSRRRAGRASSRATAWSRPALEVGGDARASTTTRSRSPRVAAGFFAPRHRGPPPPHVPHVRRARGGAVRAGAAAVPPPAQPRGAGARSRRTLVELARLGRAAAHRAAAPGRARVARRVTDAARAAPTILLDARAISRRASRGSAREIARRPSRRRRARRRAEGRADLPRRPRARDPRRRRRGRLHRDLALRARLRAGADPARPRPRPQRARRRARRGHRRHRPHARVPARATSRAAGPRRLDVCTLLDRPARRIVPLERALRGRRDPATCSCSATGCTSPTCTATCRVSCEADRRRRRSTTPTPTSTALYGASTGVGAATTGRCYGERRTERRRP